MEKIENFLREREKNHLIRFLNPADYRAPAGIFFNGKKYVDFSSNDYLGLSHHPALRDAAKQAVDKFGVGAGASRLLSGDLGICHRLEEKIAEFKRKPQALVFNSGYQANLGIISALCGKDDVIFFDRLDHASIIDGIVLSGSRMFRFAHNDMNHLDLLLKKERRKFKEAFIITETVFSMDGDKCRLTELVDLKEKYNCRLIVDEAHATGIFGARGSGVVEEMGLLEQVDLIMGAFSKALGSFGGYLAGEKRVMDYLINAARSFIYSTALPPAVIAVNLAGLDLIEKEPFRRRVLLESAEYFREKLRQKGFNVRGETQIVPLILGDNGEALRVSGKLQEQGYWARAVRPPTVPRREARVRFSIIYDHSKEILDRAVSDIEKCYD